LQPHMRSEALILLRPHESQVADPMIEAGKWPDDF